MTSMDTFTTKATEALSTAQHAAQTHQHGQVSALHLLSALLEDAAGVPRTLLGIPGLNPWNVLLVAVLAAWAVSRRREQLSWDLPGSLTVLPGMTANVTFAFGDQATMAEVLVVPAKAVGEDADGRFVFLLEGQVDGVVARKQRVVVGNLSSQGFEILQGLEQGDMIATAGLQTLLDGQEVRVKQDGAGL